MSAVGSSPCIIAAVAALVATPWLSGCSALSSCDTSNESNDPDIYTSGTTVDHQYMSSPWTGPLLHFPGGRRYDLIHNLGCQPREISIWLSFGEQGLASGTAAPSAGNASVIQDVTDQMIRIKNDTCTEYYVLVTASCLPKNDAGAADLDAGLDGGD